MASKRDFGNDFLAVFLCRCSVAQTVLLHDLCEGGCGTVTILVIVIFSVIIITLKMILVIRMMFIMIMMAMLIMILIAIF